MGGNAISPVVTHLLGVSRRHRHALRPAVVQIRVWYPSRRSCAAWRLLGLSGHTARSTVWGICTRDACGARQRLQHTIHLQLMSERYHVSHAAPSGTAISHVQPLATPLTYVPLGRTQLPMQWGNIENQIGLDAEARTF